MQQRPPRRRRARPVADAPIDSLLARAEEITKGWLLALIEEEPLGSAPAILVLELTRDGPRVSDAIVRALADDADLRRLEPGGPLEPLVSRTGELAGARGVEATSRAVDALAAVIWSALRGSLADPDADQVVALGERLMLAIAQVRAAALRRLAGKASAASSDAPWVGAIDDQIRCAERSDTPLSLLLIELEDAERVAAADGASEAGATFAKFAQAARSVVRRRDILACETETRAWVIARDTARLGAHALAERIARAVPSASLWRGAPLGLAVGVAVLGEDGATADELIEAAERAMFAAAASGIGPAAEPASDEPARPTGPRLLS